MVVICMRITTSNNATKTQNKSSKRTSMEDFEFIETQRMLYCCEDKPPRFTILGNPFPIHFLYVLYYKIMPLRDTGVLSLSFHSFSRIVNESKTLPKQAEDVKLTSF